MGKIKYEVEGKLTFLLILMNINDVRLYNPEQNNDKCLFTIKECDRTKAENALCSCGKIYSVVNDNSVNTFVNRIKKRIGIFVGIALGIVISVIWSLTVTDIKVSGNKIIEENYIVEKIASINKFPVAKSELDLKNIEKLLISLDGISNVSLEVKGNTLFVNILEEFQKPNIVDFDDKSDIISNYDAIVTEITTYSGEAKVKCGDTVKKGDVLISHVKTLADGTVLESKALGSVKGRVWVSKEYVIAPERVVYERTGKSTTYFTRGDFRRDIKIPYENYEYEKSQFYYKSMFPIRLNKYVFYETKIKTEKINYQDEKNKIITEKTKEIEKSLPETATKVKTWYSEKIVDKNVVLVIYYEIIDSLIE